MSSLSLDPLAQWRADMEASLRREYGWLALSGLFWLAEGENPVGSAAENPVRLPKPYPDMAGIFTLSGREVRLSPEPNVAWRLGETKMAETSPALKADSSNEPDFLFLGDLRLMIIERAGQFAVRIWDPQNPVRMNFEGRKWFEPDEGYRVQASIKPYEPAKAVMMDDIVGIQRAGEMHAALKFTLGGQTLSLDAQRLEDDSYYIIFKDVTAGESTYPAGRYLVTEVAAGDRVVIDFNRAYNPPCAFTDFATCPLPLPENILPVRIEAGERFEADL